MTASPASSTVAPSLNALSRAQYDEAKLRFNWRFRCHVGALIAAVLSAYVAAVGVAYAFAVVALVSEGIAWWLRFDGQRLKSVADDGRRRVLLVTALGMDEAPLDVANLRLSFTGRAEKRAPKFENDKYYASKEQPSPARLKDCLQESAFWSAELYRAAARKELTPLIGFAVVVVATFVGLPLASGDTALLVARGLVVVLASFAASDELNRVVDWYSAASQCEVIDRRLETIDTAKPEPILAAFADYQVVTACVAPITTSVYETNHDRLNELWKKRTEARAL